MKRILLVDDHEPARRVLRHFLEAHGYHCTEKEDGAAALAWIEEGQSVDLVVTDNQMPILDGFQLLESLAMRFNLKDLPVILYSGSLTEELKQQAVQVGAYAVLSKPYNFQDFLETVEQAIERL